MNDKDRLKDLFSEKLRNYEAPVRPELWTSISSTIGSGATSGLAGGTSLLSKLIIVSSITAASIVGGYFVYTASDSQNHKTTQSTKHELPVKEELYKVVEKQSNVSKAAEQNNKLSNSAETFVETVLPQLKEESNQEIEKLIRYTVLTEIKIDPTIDLEPIVQQINCGRLPDDEIRVQEQPVSERMEINSYDALPDKNLPNVFTPNSDGSNDEFVIESSGLRDFSIVVMDMKSNTVFRSTDSDFKWNGIAINGEMVESGNYIYYITALDENGKQVNKYKTLMVRR